MQIDLANTLVHKVYFLLFYLFSPFPFMVNHLASPLPREGSGEAFRVCIKTGRAH